MSQSARKACSGAGGCGALWLAQCWRGHRGAGTCCSCSSLRCVLTRLVIWLLLRSCSERVFAGRSVMLTEVRVDERAQPRGDMVQSAAEKGTDPGLAESVRAWVQHLLDRNDTDVDLVRMAPGALVPGRSAFGRLTAAVKMQPGRVQLQARPSPDCQG